jgi:hypothetical protein
MAVYKIFASADATLYSAYPEDNTGLDEILEVASQNSDVPLGILADGNSDDIRRAVIQFSNTDLQAAYALVSGSTWESNLRLYLATATNLNTLYSIEVRQVSQSWEMGTGKFMDDPPTKNGVCWYTTSSYTAVSGSTTNWVGSQYLFVPGGGSWTNTFTTQSFGYKDNKDVNVNVTPIVNNWVVGSQSNNGFIVKHPLAIEQNTGSYIGLKFFSIDTHTIYPPTLEFKWNDAVYNTGSLSVVSNSNTVITLGNNAGIFKNDTSKYIFRVNARDKYPTRAFTTSSIYTTNKALPSSSYWALEDVKTGERVIDFDTIYTKISCDSNGSYFSIYMNGLEPERFYKILVKTNLATGEIVDIDNNNVFKLVR